MEILCSTTMGEIAISWIDVNWAIVIVEDQGVESTASDMERLLEPFKRGENTHNIMGYGLGLMIVATVAHQHGGKVKFEDGKTGGRARLLLRRSVLLI